MIQLPLDNIFWAIGIYKSNEYREITESCHFVIIEFQFLKLTNYVPLYSGKCILFFLNIFLAWFSMCTQLRFCVLGATLLRMTFIWQILCICDVVIKQEK